MNPAWLAVDNIERRSALSVDEFIQQYESKRKPVVLKNVVTQWKAFQLWSEDYLRKTCGDTAFDVGGYQMTLNNYFDYMTTTSEELPLYLFDKSFVERAPMLGTHYSVPPYFKDDLFQLLGKDRPDFRWLIIGSICCFNTTRITPRA